jgi:hypothetical protein
MRRLSSREEIDQGGAELAGGEARVVAVDAGVEGMKGDSGLVTKPPAPSLLIVEF